MVKITPRSQTGFTLIELVIVLLILGVLSAVAVPQFMDLTEDAEQGAVNSQADALNSANTINYAVSRLRENGYTEIEGSNGCNQAKSLVNNWQSDRFSIGNGYPSLSSFSNISNDSAGASGYCHVELEENENISAPFTLTITSG